MPNTFITLQNIARMSLERLMDNLVMPQLCYRDFSNDFTDLGDTIQVRKPPILEAKEFTAGSTVENQDVKEESVYVKLDKIATVDTSWGAIESAVNVSEAKLRADVIEPASAALAEKINADGLAVYKAIPGFLGTAGTTPSALSDIGAARKQLNKNKAPVRNRVAIWDPDADGSLSLIQNLTRVNEAGNNAALREGEIGRVLGIDNYMSQGVKTHEKGTLAATGSGAKILLNGAASNVKTVELDTGGTALTGTLKAGDILTVGTAVVTVAEDATAANNTITVKLLTPLTAADNAEVSIGANYAANLVFHRNAIAFVTRPLSMPYGAEGYVTTDPYSGLSLRVVRDYDIKTKKNMMSIDILYGYAVVYPEMALRYLG